MWAPSRSRGGGAAADQGVKTGLLRGALRPGSPARCPGRALAAAMLAAGNQNDSGPVPSAAPVTTPSDRHSPPRIPYAVQRGHEEHSSDVPGLAKHTSTPHPPASVLISAGASGFDDHTSRFCLLRFAQLCGERLGGSCIRDASVTSSARRPPSTSCRGSITSGQPSYPGAVKNSRGSPSVSRAALRHQDGYRGAVRGDEAEKQALLLGEPRLVDHGWRDGWPLVMLRLPEVDAGRRRN